MTELTVTACLLTYGALCYYLGRRHAKRALRRRYHPEASTFYVRPRSRAHTRWRIAR